MHGHSRGGHGAWALATRIPDRVLGVASACGWYSREEYGDANNFWVPWETLWKNTVEYIYIFMGRNSMGIYIGIYIGYIYISYIYLWCIYGPVLRLSTPPLPPPMGWVPRYHPPVPSICKLLAAFLRSSFVFARSLQHF